MNKINAILKPLARLSYILGSASIVIGIGLSIVYQPVVAASNNGNSASFDINAQSGDACIAPSIWNETVRLYYTTLPSKTWSFTVEDPEMNVTLKWFWYQDYERDGCPKDCLTDRNCQLDEIAHVSSPLGDFDIEDGVIGPADGSYTLNGPLSQGAYSVTAIATGRGSINIRMVVTKNLVPTVVPTDTSTPTPTEAPPTPTPTEIPVNPTASPSPSPTATETPVVQTPVNPSATPTATSTQVLPVGPSPSPTPTEEERPRETPSPTTIATLPPPATNPSGTQPAILIPVTGADLTEGSASLNIYQKLFLNFGISLLGLGLIFHALGNHFRKN